MAEPLKPCPFCGSLDIDISPPDLRGDRCASCFFCGVSTPPKSTRAEAITAWNTRPDETRQIGEK